MSATARPSASVFICALPRTGSSLVGLLLGQNGFGRPAEWFWRDDVERNKQAWGISRFEDYLVRVLDEGTSERGVFGAKVMWGYLGDVLFELRRLRGEFDADDVSVLRSFFGEPSFVWVRRRDAVAQAVSWARAVQTGQWAANQPATGEASFDFEQIDALYHVARIHDGCWRRWFDSQALEPFELVYEELCRDRERVTGEVLEYLGHQGDAALEPPAFMHHQADAMNEDWAARYREAVAGRPANDAPRGRGD
ncbi:MAG TPA: Stf0 family sulfotransferase [Gaiellaceae bacterium]|nr:Stf0 family sulfotransferase [Gaiellaceae bacterium]